jgi:hypothetical protein
VGKPSRRAAEAPASLSRGPGGRKSPPRRSNLRERGRRNDPVGQRPGDLLLTLSLTTPAGEGDPDKRKPRRSGAFKSGSHGTRTRGLRIDSCARRVRLGPVESFPNRFSTFRRFGRVTPGAAGSRDPARDPSRAPEGQPRGSPGLAGGRPVQGRHGRCRASAPWLPSLPRSLLGGAQGIDRTARVHRCGLAQAALRGMMDTATEGGAIRWPVQSRRS